MAINKNFVIKNGVEVNSSLIVGDSTLNKVGIATTVPGYTLHVGMDNGRGGIGATDLTVTGITTLGVGASAAGALQVTGISTFDGLIDANGGISARTAAIQDLTAQRVVLAGTGGELEDSGDLTFDGDKLSVGIATIWDATGNVAIAGILTVGGSSITMGGTSIVDSNFQLKNIDSLDATTLATIESAIVAGPNIFDDLEITGLSTFVGFSTFESGFRVSGVGTFENDVDFYKSGFTTSVSWDQSENALEFTDSAAIRVGTGSDLAIYHDGTDNIIRAAGSASPIKIQGHSSNASTIHISARDDKETIKLLNNTNAPYAELYYDNTKVFETSPQGIIVSGVTTSNRLNISGVSTFTSVGSNLIPDADGSRNIGAATSEWGDLFIDGTATIDTLQVDENATVTGNLTVSGNVDLGNAATDSITPTGRFDAHIVPLTDGNIDLGASGVEFNDLYIDGTAYIDDLRADTAKVADLTDNRVVIAGSAGELEDDANFTYDGSKLNIGAGTGATVYNNGNATFSGIVTATVLQASATGGLNGRLIGVHTSADGGGVGIASTTAHVGYGITYIDFKGPGVSTVYYSSVTGVSTVYFQGGGDSSVGAAGTWQNDGSQGISTAKSVGINTVGVAVTALMGGEKGASSGIGASMLGLYISNGMVVYDNALNDNHYIGTAFNGLMAGPVTINGVLTVDGNYVVV